MNMEFSMVNIQFSFPEIFMTLSAITMLMIGIFYKNVFRTISLLAIVVHIIAAILIIYSHKNTVLFEQFIVDSFSIYCKFIILIGSAVAILMTINFSESQNIECMELPVLITLSSLGMMIMVSATTMLSLYIGIELQSLALYIIVTIHKTSVRSTEAGLKYFILGSIASGILLYGISIVYGFTGTTKFSILHDLYIKNEIHFGAVVGMIFIFSALCFKLSAVPFHMWTPDVYEGSPTPITSFLSLSPKVASLGVLIRIFISILGGNSLTNDWQEVIILISILSMILSAFAGLRQKNIKRLMAYSSIGHIGFAFVGLACGNLNGIQSVLVYISIYVIMNCGIFAVILSMCCKNKMVENIHDLSGLAQTHPIIAIMTTILIFSMAGIPPMAGFFSKFYVFKSAIQSGMIHVVFIGLLTSVISAYYYLRIIKIMYFDEPINKFEFHDTQLNIILTISSIITIIFCFFPNTLLNITRSAAQALFI